MPEYPGETPNYPTTPDQYATHHAERDVNESALFHYAVRPVVRTAHPYAHGVFRVETDGSDDEGRRVAVYGTYEQATYVANTLNEYAGQEIC